MKDLIIRNALSSDMETVLSLIKELADFENASDQVKMTIDRLIEDGFGKEPLFKAIVAVYNGEICGYALYYYGYSTWNGKTLYLEDFMIKSEYRRMGIGQIVFNEIKKIANQQMVKRLDWQVLDWNKTAIDFYKKNKASFEGEWLNGRLFSLDLKNF
jgi:ribosomal protein S18 acetylase RimI-like enzyme